MKVKPDYIDAVTDAVLRIFVGALLAITVGLLVWFGAKFLFFGAVAVAVTFVCWGLGMMVIEGIETWWEDFKR